jgi:transcriptional regulator with XRE-family HTH domain
MQITVKEIERLRVFDNLSFAAIGKQLGVTKQYLSFICKKKKNQPEIVNRQLFLEFDQLKNNYPVHERIRIKRRLLGLTQGEVAKEVGTFGPVVVRIEKGQLRSSMFIKRLHDYLEV